MPAKESRKVLIVGASGGVGRRLTALLHDAGHSVAGIHNSDAGANVIIEAGGLPVHADLVGDSLEDLATPMRGVEAVVFAAGAGGGGTARTEAIDRDGAIKVAEAAAAAGVRRFVLVSVFMDAWRGTDSPGPEFESYMAAKRAADAHLSGTDLDWLIIRPGTLLDEAGTGLVSAGTALTYGSVSRDDVAAFIAASIFEPALNRTAIELTAGDQPIAEAVADLLPRAWQPLSSD